MEHAAIYRERRERFMAQIPGGVAIFHSGAVLHTHSGSEHKYRPSNDFYYLTGFSEPDSVCVLLPDHEERRYVLFVPDRDPEKETWNGVRAGVDGATKEYHADAAFPNNQISEELPKLSEDADRIFYILGQDDVLDQRVLDLYRQSSGRRATSGKGPNVLADPREMLYEMRLTKDEHEIGCLRRAAQISADGHIAAMKMVKPGMYEHEVQATVEYAFRQHGAAPAFPTICGSANNATILHYTTNDRQIQDGDLVLIDAGADYQCYAGDITRTMPANGRFTDEQRAIYEIVLAANLAALEEIAPVKSVERFHERATEVIVDGLVDLGLLEGERDKIIEEGDHKKFYMHGTGHWLGMAVHDVGKKKHQGEACEFATNMLTTVEPGIYIADGEEGVDPKYWGIGVRIEDDVLVTEEGCEVLTAAVPKTVEAIEALMRG